MSPRPGTIQVGSFKEALPFLAIMAAFVGGVIWAAVQLDIEEIFGVTLGWSWSLVDSGQVEVVAFTPKMTDVDAPPAFLLPGEQLEATIDYRIERGSARVSVSDEGWFEFGWPGFDEFVWLHHETNIRAPRQDTVRVTATRPGLYTVEGRIKEATGTFRLDWRVVNPRNGGRAVRFLRFLFLSLPGFVFLILVSILLGTLLFGRSD